LKQIDYLFQFLKEKEKRKSLSEKGFIAYKKSLVDPCEICWNLSEDEKYEKIFEGKGIIAKKIEMKINSSLNKK
jgi:hypothetical protein